MSKKIGEKWGGLIFRTLSQFFSRSRAFVKERETAVTQARSKVEVYFFIRIWGIFSTNAN